MRYISICQAKNDFSHSGLPAHPLINDKIPVKAVALRGFFVLKIAGVFVA